MISIFFSLFLIILGLMLLILSPFLLSAKKVKKVIIEPKQSQFEYNEQNHINLIKELNEQDKRIKAKIKRLEVELKL